MTHSWLVCGYASTLKSVEEKWVNFLNIYVVNCFSGTLKALELENQVLKLRNAQLELAGNTETIKG